MEKLILFIAEQWLLVAALVSCVLMLSYHDSRRAGRSLTPQQVINLVNGGEVLLVDLRDKADFKKGHILNSENLPFNKFDGDFERLNADKNKPVVLICKLGQHAGAVGKKLSAKGYSQVFRLKGGIGEWQAMKLPLVK
jgi:rhodanese-related sulfurtransferase